MDLESYQIFISYRRDGGEFFGKILYDKLNAKGYKVFFDVESMRSGPFNTQLYSVIDQCQDFLLILSPHALDRCANPGDWVCSEISYAMQKQKNILPILMRDFTWPAQLPASIAQLPQYECEEFSRTSSQEHIDASVARICNRFLKSRPAGTYQYRLADREYYPIKTPWKQRYKSSSDTPGVFMGVLAYFARAGGGQSWRPEEGWDTLEQLLEYTPFVPQPGWYRANRGRLEGMREKAAQLRRYQNHGEDDVCFYAQAVQYAYGCLTTLSGELLRRASPLGLRHVLCYCIDWPEDRYGEMTSACGEAMREQFASCIPLAFTAWPNYYSRKAGAGGPGGRVTAEERQNFTSHAILLFDFMLDWGMLINDSFQDVPHRTAVRDQLLCYYKWLKKNKLFLPRELQERIYRDL